MKTRRLPRKLFDGKVRTSTILLCVLFAAILALYLVVRPAQETGPSSPEENETTPTETAPPEPSPAESTRPETTPAQTGPSETPPPETTPDETAPPETAPEAPAGGSSGASEEPGPGS